MEEPVQRATSPKRQKRRTGRLIFGLILVLAGSAGLFWNEWRSASEMATLRAAGRSVMSVDPGRVPGDADGRLVHVAAEARPSGIVEDPVFGLGDVALRLDRIVEMYQWREHTQGAGDNRTTRYEKVWAEGRIPSERFRERVGRSNPPAPPYQSARFQPPEVAIGAYGLTPALVDLLPADRAIAVPRGRELFVRGGVLAGDGTGFFSGDPRRPEIGDVRVRFRVVPAGEVSVLAGLDGARLGPWRAANGGEVAIAVPGLETAEAMLGHARRVTALRTWGVRAAATLGVFVGCSLLLGRAGERVASLAALRRRLGPAAAPTVALGWALVVVAIAWVLFRPLASLGLVVATSVLLGLLYRVQERWPERMPGSGRRRGN